MTIKEIAQSVAKEYGLPIHELKRKQYCGNPHYSMKVNFVKQCRDHGFSNPEIAEFMDYSKSSISELYSIAMAGKPRFVWQQILHELKQGAVTKEDFPTIRMHVKRIRKKGYHVYRTPDGKYKLG